MNYSTTHLKLSEHLKCPDVLTVPRHFLGQNYKTVLNFWTYLDYFTEEQFVAVTERYFELKLNPFVKMDSAENAEREAENVIGADLTSLAYTSATYAIDNNAQFVARDIRGVATWELIGMHKLFEQGKSLTFVPLFDFTGNYELHSLNVEDIESRIQRINDFIGPKVDVEASVSMAAEDLKSFIEDVELFD
jgi:hypothetical protein